jgi:predicted RNA-binding Zn-ribbon protein involved in translation (DUF1610 family)
MKEYNFSCPNCDEPFEIVLRPETTRALFTECEVLDPRLHNLTQISECTNCGQKNTVYYCITSHPVTFVGEAV